MGLAFETLGVEFVNVLGAGGPGRKPAIRRDDLEPADRGAVAWGVGEFGDDRFPRQLGCLYGVGVQLLERGLLGGRGWGVGPGVARATELDSQFCVVLAGVHAGACSDLGR